MTEHDKASRDSRVRLVPFDTTYLERSWVWLNDAEMRELTMTPLFSREQQRVWFDSLQTRLDYRIWGVCVDDVPAGAAGLKNIGEVSAEYWGYLGEKQYWGQGLGRAMALRVVAEARGLGLRQVYLRVGAANTRAVRLYRSLGYVDTDAQARVRHMRLAL